MSEWEMVPMAPTPEMIAAGDGQWSWPVNYAKRTWSAMLAAAPTPPADVSESVRLHDIVLQMRETLGNVEVTLRHARTFIVSREKMHADGVALYDETLAHVRDVHARLAAPTPPAEPPADECQYAKDVGMPEYRCAVRCQYAAEPHDLNHDLRAENTRLAAERDTSNTCLFQMQEAAKSLAAERDALRKALQEVVDVLGPDAGCSENKCEGCLYEMGHALKVARAALAARAKEGK